jgi:hypothetical protein
MSRDAELEIFGEEGLKELRELSFVPPECEGANWAKDPWFARDENDWLSEAGFSRERCRELVAPLRRIFPPEVCRRILRRPMDAPLLFGLFQGMPGFLIPLLDAAASVAVVGKLEGDPLLRSLRQRETFASASSELSLWADLVRANLRVFREPGVLVGTSTRYPDFGVQVGAEYLYIEASQLQESAHARAARLLEDEIGRCTALVFENRQVCIRCDEEFGRGLGARVIEQLGPGGLLSEYRTRRFIDSDVLPNVRHTLEQIRSTGGAPGRYVIPNVGLIEVSTSTESGAEIHALDRPTVDATAERLWRKVVDEAVQLPPGRSRVARGVVAIDVGSAALIQPVADAMNAMLASGRLRNEAEKVSGLDAVLLRGRWPTFGGSRERVAQLLLWPGVSPSIEFGRLARAASPGARGRLAGALGS